MPKNKKQYSRTHFQIPRFSWKRVSSEQFESSKREAFDASDSLAPLELLAKTLACGNPMPEWLSNYTCSRLLRFIRREVNTLDEAFSIKATRGTDVWEQRELANDYRELTGEMHKLIMLGCGVKKAAEAVSGNKATTANIRGMRAIEDAYYDGFQAFWNRYYERDPELKQYVEEQKKILFKKYQIKPSFLRYKTRNK